MVYKSYISNSIRRCTMYIHVMNLKCLYLIKRNSINYTITCYVEAIDREI